MTLEKYTIPPLQVIIPQYVTGRNLEKNILNAIDNGPETFRITFERDREDGVYSAYTPLLVVNLNNPLPKDIAAGIVVNIDNLALAALRNHSIEQKNSPEMKEFVKTRAIRPTVYGKSFSGKEANQIIYLDKIRAGAVTHVLFSINNFDINTVKMWDRTASSAHATFRKYLSSKIPEDLLGLILYQNSTKSMMGYPVNDQLDNDKKYFIDPILKEYDIEKKRREKQEAENRKYARMMDSE